MQAKGEEQLHFHFYLFRCPSHRKRRASSVIRIRPIKYTVYTPSSKKTTVSSPFGFSFFFFFFIFARTANSPRKIFSPLYSLIARFSLLDCSLSHWPETSRSIFFFSSLLRILVSLQLVGSELFDERIFNWFRNRVMRSFYSRWSIRSLKEFKRKDFLKTFSMGNLGEI